MKNNLETNLFKLLNDIETLEEMIDKELSKGGSND